MPSSLVMEEDPFTELTTTAHSIILVELPIFHKRARRLPLMIFRNGHTVIRLYTEKGLVI
ncbi:hypothetical protein DPMN_165774 [Dreissena polymorpha]|uniref:Uncharacterized protein n=1 Tax=Dreissena polymorpha TaxID=45954 RepID=A0A9D4EWR5_DREPO|nr:hypothetical protein DPMN_165774 [Dreissena polymorpha]